MKKLIVKSKNDKFGFVDENGKVVIPFIYDHVFSFDNNKYTAVVKNGKAGFIDRQGKVVFPFIFDNATSFVKVKGENVSLVEIGDAWGQFTDKLCFLKKENNYKVIKYVFNGLHI